MKSKQLLIYCILFAVIVLFIRNPASNRYDAMPDFTWWYFTSSQLFSQKSIKKDFDLLSEKILNMDSSKIVPDEKRLKLATENIEIKSTYGANYLVPTFVFSLFRMGYNLTQPDGDYTYLLANKIVLSRISIYVLTLILSILLIRKLNPSEFWQFTICLMIILMGLLEFLIEAVLPTSQIQVSVDNIKHYSYSENLIMLLVHGKRSFNLFATTSRGVVLLLTIPLWIALFSGKRNIGYLVILLISFFHLSLAALLLTFVLIFDFLIRPRTLLNDQLIVSGSVIFYWIYLVRDPLVSMSFVLPIALFSIILLAINFFFLRHIQLWSLWESKINEMDGRLWPLIYLCALTSVIAIVFIGRYSLNLFFPSDNYVLGVIVGRTLLLFRIPLFLLLSYGIVIRSWNHKKLLISVLAFSLLVQIILFTNRNSINPINRTHTELNVHKTILLNYPCDLQCRDEIGKYADHPRIAERIIMYAMLEKYDNGNDYFVEKIKNQ